MGNFLPQMVTGEHGPQDLPLTLGSEDVPTSLVALRPYKVVKGGVGKLEALWHLVSKNLSSAFTLEEITWKLQGDAPVAPFKNFPEVTSRLFCKKWEVNK